MRKSIPLVSRQHAGIKEVRKVIADYFDGRPEELVSYLCRHIFDDCSVQKIVTPLKRQYSELVH